MGALHVLWGRASESSFTPIHWIRIFNSEITEWERKQHGERIAWYPSTRTLLGDPREMSNNKKHACYCALMGKCVERITAPVRLEEPMERKLLMSNTGGWLLISGSFRPPWTKHYDLKRHRRIHTGYSVIVNDSRKRTITVASRSQNYKFHSEEKKAKLCEGIEIKSVKIPGSVYSLDKEMCSL